jgi:hypothetical protein
MTEAEATAIVRRHFESLFPKRCTVCGREFASLRHYIEVTSPVGKPRSYDADFGDWDTTAPLGSQALANCTCGSTLALSTDGMDIAIRRELLNWMKAETERQGVPATEILDRMRVRIRMQVAGRGGDDVRE